MKTYRKRNFPVDEIRRFMEPGPIVMVSSFWKGKSNIMTMNWHMVAEFEPSLVACYIWDENYSHDLVRRSRQCVINVPTLDLKRKVVGVGNTTGREIDKFKEWKLTPRPAKMVEAPLIEECYANLECRLYDGSLIARRNIFIWEVVKAHVAVSPSYPQTMHYRGGGVFMVSGRNISLKQWFKPEML